VKAIRPTDPVVDGDLAKAGWIVLLDGLAEVQRNRIDERTVEVVMTQTSGKKTFRANDTIWFWIAVSTCATRNTLKGMARPGTVRSGLRKEK
jgi:hypothetical protein